MKTTSELKIRIVQDEYANSPDEDGDQNLFLVYAHRYFQVDRKGFEPRDIFEAIQETCKPEYEGFFVFTVFAYIHSGVSLSLSTLNYPFNDRWDVSSTGFILASKKEFKKFDKAVKVAQGLIEYWNDYLSGNVYGYIIEDEEGNHLDSCFRFYGDPDESGCKKEAEESLKSLKKEQTKQFKVEMNHHQSDVVY